MLLLFQAYFLEGYKLWVKFFLLDDPYVSGLTICCEAFILALCTNPSLLFIYERVGL